MQEVYRPHLSRNGYAQSILQDNLGVCYLCGRTTGKIDFHEVFPGRNRQKSKYYGLWVCLCHETCHLGLAHKDMSVADMLKQRGQIAAMTRYGWTVQDFINKFGRSYI